MTLLNTFANLGGTWPSSFIMWAIGHYTVAPDCSVGDDGVEVCVGGRDAYFPLQVSLVRSGEIFPTLSSLFLRNLMLLASLQVVLSTLG